MESKGCSIFVDHKYGFEKLEKLKKLTKVVGERLFIDRFQADFFSDTDFDLEIINIAKENNLVVQIYQKEPPFPCSQRFLKLGREGILLLRKYNIDYIKGEFFENNKMLRRVYEINEYFRANNIRRKLIIIDELYTVFKSDSDIFYFGEGMSKKEIYNNYFRRNFMNSFEEFENGYNFIEMASCGHYGLMSDAKNIKFFG